MCKALRSTAEKGVPAIERNGLKKLYVTFSAGGWRVEVRGWRLEGSVNASILNFQFSTFNSQLSILNSQ
jgi:hypothetical protein